METGTGDHYLARTSALINQNWNDITLFPVNSLTTTDLFELQRSNVVSWQFCCWLMDWTEKGWKGQHNSHNRPMLFCQTGFKKIFKKQLIMSMLANTCIVFLNYKAQQYILFSHNSLLEERIWGRIRPMPIIYKIGRQFCAHWNMSFAHWHGNGYSQS